jgi:hypothetical protein
MRDVVGKYSCTVAHITIQFVGRGKCIIVDRGREQEEEGVRPSENRIEVDQIKSSKIVVFDLIRPNSMAFAK